MLFSALCAATENNPIPAGNGLPSTQRQHKNKFRCLFGAAAAPTPRDGGPDRDEVFFYIAKPGQESSLPDEAAAYYFLTCGGQASDQALADLPEKGGKVVDQSNESAITAYVAQFPQALRQNYVEGTSAQVGEGSDWTIDPATGKVSAFTLVLDGKTYTSNEYGIRWVKFSRVETVDQDGYRDTWHMDGILYKKTTVQTMLDEIAPCKNIDNGTIYDDDGKVIESSDFAFTLTSETYPDVSVALQANDVRLVTGTERPMELVDEADRYLELLPGSYQITEVQSDDDLKRWVPADPLCFTVNTDGSIETADEIQRIKNRAQTYQLHYDKNTDDPTVSGIPGDMRYYRYNMYAGVAEDTPLRDGYRFKGWSLTPGPNGEIVGRQVQIKGETTLYAQWEETYDLLYDANAGADTVHNLPAAQTGYLLADFAEISAQKPERAGYLFLGWSTTPDGELYTGTQILFAVPDDITLYARWEALYTLTYDANAGRDTVDGLPVDETAYHAGDEATVSAQVPARDGYWFRGWSTAPDGELYTGAAITITQDTTLYAQWEPWYPFALRLADMTVYQGGSGAGYGGIVDETGAVVGDNSLPEPGFCLTLPDAVNEALAQAGGDRAPDIAITATAQDGTPRRWTLEPYGAAESSAQLDAQERFVYKLVPADGQPPVRVQVRDAAGNTVASDDFALDTALYTRYEVSLYTGGVRPETVEMEITLPGTQQVFRCRYDASGSEPGTLTVRHASDGAATVPADTTLHTDGSFAVQVREGQKFYLNETDEGAAGVSVAHTDVALLVDDLVPGDYYVYTLALYQKAVTAAGFQSSGVDGRYFDLVETGNGNAWLTPADGETVTVFWACGDAMLDRNIKLYHFEGLDREMPLDEVTARIAATPATEVPFTKVEGGITFEVDSFSPFVLVYDNTFAPQPGGDDEPDEDTPDTDTPDEDAGGSSDGSGSSDNAGNTGSNSSTGSQAGGSAAPAAAAAAAPAAAPAAIPQTGDALPLGLLAGLMAAAAGGMAALLALRKRRCR